MAWQTPKTDWSRADGVRDSDLNRIEGNILELYGIAAVPAATTLYVSTSGNDTTGRGTSSAPYRTITKALSTLQKNLNGKSVTINIAAGTYAENVTISGFTGGYISLTGTVGADVSVSGLTVDACTVVVSAIDLIVSSSTGLRLTNGAIFITTSNFSSTATTSIGINATGCSQAHFGSNVAISNATTAVVATNNARLFVFQLTTSAVGTAMSASNGGIIGYGSHTGGVNSTVIATSAGGRIYTGTGTNVGGGGGLPEM